MLCITSFKILTVWNVFWWCNMFYYIETFKIIHTDKITLPNTLIFKVYNNIFNYDILLIATNIQPMGSAYYDKKECFYGVIMLEELISDLLGVHDCNIIILGELNSRAGRLNTQKNFAIQDKTCSKHPLRLIIRQIELLILMGNVYFL